MPKVEINYQKIIIALESRSPKSLTEVYRILGGKKLSGAEANRIRQACPGIEQVLAQNKAAGSVKSKPEVKPAKVSQSEDGISTPYRKGSAYSKVYQILAEHPEGISRADLIREAARRCKKPASRSAFDVAVVVSPRESCTGPRHRSARDSYFLKVEGSCYTLRTN